MLKQFSKDLSEVEPFKFYNFECNRYFKTLDIKNNFWIMPSYSLFDKFSTEINKPMTSGGTVTFIALQIAAHLKYKRIFIIGMDHNFDSTSKPNLTEKELEKTTTISGQTISQRAWSGILLIYIEAKKLIKKH